MKKVILNLLYGTVLLLIISFISWVTDGFGIYVPQGGFGWPLGFWKLGLLGLGEGNFSFFKLLIDIGVFSSIVYLVRMILSRKQKGLN